MGAVCDIASLDGKTLAAMGLTVDVGVGAGPSGTEMGCVVFTPFTPVVGSGLGVV
jgi:hypothetical protein